MKTVKQVSQLTGISVRTLQYYDEIGLFKPTKVTVSGYRLYDAAALEILQQILLFRELHFPLKDIKAIMQDPQYDKNDAFIRQQKLLEAKRDRLNDLLALLNKLIKGEKSISFKEFDMSEYFGLLKGFRNNHEKDIVKIWGSVDKFDQTVDKIKENEERAAKAAIQFYGSIDNYTAAMKKYLNELPKKAQNLNHLISGDYIAKTAELMKKLTLDLRKDVSSNEIQCIVGEWVDLVKEETNGLKNNDWHLLTEGFLLDNALIEANDKMYGKGASNFIGKALKVYWNDLKL
ncbi:MerR family transcriptional regulator [Caproicibacterium sp. BJN0003]|uniref:MerR family transcriptional regulator n=1 Tax=Caproicibacterium sp. BJN0003 TaxID=2994078 RepID=UPI00224F1031|nr:MerR family transcriptional regulator [Caproicibacterium sp. BJN0003]UZT81747.1 MerR family transcriptional regulator [Caproicibacterium sp. BJN0003]